MAASKRLRVGACSVEINLHMYIWLLAKTFKNLDSEVCISNGVVKLLQRSAYITTLFEK
jgi:hypothetical protein